MYNLFKICLPPYFPNRIENISALRNFVKVGGGVRPPPIPPSNNLDWVSSLVIVEKERWVTEAIFRSKRPQQHN